MLLLWGLCLGTGGWWAWTRLTRQQQTDQQLQQAQAAFSKAQEQLTLLDGERRKLADAYDVLKDRLAKSDEELKRAGKSSEEMTANAERLSRERAELQRQLEEATRTAEHRLQALAQQATVDRTALEAKLSETTRASRELDATIEQLQRRVQQQASAREQRQEQLMELSRAYEALAQAPPPSSSPEAPAGVLNRRRGQLNPAIAPRPSAVGGMVVQQPMGGRDVAPIGAGLPVPRALPVGLHRPVALTVRKRVRHT